MNNANKLIAYGDGVKSHVDYRCRMNMDIFFILSCNFILYDERIST